MKTATVRKNNKKFTRLIETDFRPDIAIPKYYQIKNILKSCIADKTFSPGEQLPVADIISEQCRVTRVTVDKALSEMEQEGLVKRIQGKGTFVASRENRLAKEEITALFLHAKGDVYGDFTKHLVHNLHALGYYSFLFDISLAEQKARYNEEIQRMQNLLDMKLGAAIVEGLSFFPFETLRKARKKIGTFIFALTCETPQPPPGIKVLTDYREGGYQAVKHLLDNGHKKIILLTYPPQKEPYFIIHSLFEGCRKAYRERCLDFNNLFTVVKDDQAETGEHLRTILSSRDRPTAVFCFGDNRARQLFSLADKLNLSVPGDLSIIGYYNTPWCWRFNVPLSSVSIQEETIAAQIADVLKCEGTRKYSYNDVVWIKPKLVIRAST